MNKEEKAELLENLKKLHVKHSNIYPADKTNLIDIIFDDVYSEVGKIKDE